MVDERFDDDGLPPVPESAPPQTYPDAAEGDSIAWMADSETHLPEVEHRAHVPGYQESSSPLPVCDIDTPADIPCEEPTTVRAWSSAAVVTAASLGALAGALIVAAALVWLFGLWPGVNDGDAGSPRIASPRPVTISTDADVDAAVAVAEKVDPSVVNVGVEQRGFNPFTGSSGILSSGNGSGVIIREDGYILTNNHVVEGADRIVVTVGPDDLEAEVVGVDPQTDLAVLKLEGDTYTPIEIGSSEDLKVGQFVVAIGSPFGLEKTVTSGIVSALQRSSLAEGATSITAYTNLIQTDAAINPGNSGGALVDAQGRLVGINTLIQSPTGSSAGIGFAIPVDFAMDVAEQLIETGRVVHPYMGVSTSTIDEATARQYGMSVTQGALVQFVEPDSPAEEAGIKRGDIIIEIDGEQVKGTQDVYTGVRANKVGDTIEVLIVRNDTESTLSVTLAGDFERP
ncbi:MAG: S1C family serine protease [Coriobacteriia bacterium]